MDPFDTSGEPIARALRHVNGGRVGMWPNAGNYQFNILKSAGMLPSHRVLEIGCGCLNAGHRIIEYLDPGNYTGIEPEAWLVEAGSASFRVAKPFRHVEALDFDARHGTFDFIYSHSVLSHASRAQMAQYIAACVRQLRDGGKALASLRLCRGRFTETNADSWRYPDVTYFEWSTVEEIAQSLGVPVRNRPDIRDGFMAATNGDHEHDWIELFPEGRGR